MESSSKKGRTIHSEARAVIRKVIKACDAEARAGRVKYSVKQTNLRVSKYTDVSMKSISRIPKESAKAGESSLSTPGKHRKRHEERNVHCDEFDRRVIRDTIHDFYLVKKQVLTCPKLVVALKQKISFPWLMHTLRRILKEMGFKWKKCQSFRKVLVERPHIVDWRCRYLRAIR
jgi:transposase